VGGRRGVPDENHNNPKLKTKVLRAFYVLKELNAINNVLINIINF
jgi:hypothetical protein